MTPNPFDDLEQQLRAAVEQRSRRRKRVSRRTLLAVAAALALTGGVAAGATLLNRDADTAAVNRALARGETVAMTLPACSRALHSRPVKVISGAPSAAVLAQLGVFRRAQIPADRRLPAHFSTGLPFSGAVFLKDSVRIAHTDNGARVALYVTRGVGRFPGMPADPVACAQATQDEAVQAAAKDNAEVRARVQRITTGRLDHAKAVAAGASDEINFMQITSNGHIGGGSATYVSNGKIPALTNYGQGKLHGHRTVNISGLVPDGITTVRAVDLSGPSGQRAAPITVKVSDNVYSLRAPRRMGPRIILDWRNAAGTVVRRVHVTY